ncbi:FabD/lysophospholipase-like protein [Mycena sanguinolenta]|uniref:FabD/lysophospholipase-like protein n=1 Tax=Mycena sanguinolenta TaxID=230812 RepID=A0A8H6X374_9AGAR|nr:FabD/lysophospholipase-like protein [Mycena sanguinolenta]
MSSTDSPDASASQPSRKSQWNPFRSRSSKSDPKPASVRSAGDNSSHEAVNIHMSGGQGGRGGSGGSQGGGGGTGEGPTLQNHIKTEHLTMNITNTGSAMNTVHTSPAVVQASQAINHCPPPSQIFHGRQAILDSMHRFFAQETGKQKRYVLYGLGGAGKTQIALKFIEGWIKFTDQLFVDASSTNTIETGLTNIAVTNQAGKSSQDELMWLARKHEDWLLFLDNADDPEINLNKFFPKCHHGNIIITTRNYGARIHGAHSEVSNMEKSDAVILLLKSAQCAISATNEKLAAEIVKALWYFPLAIVQAGAFISKSEALDTYLDLFLKNKTELLKKKSTQTYDDYAWAVYTTWEMSLSKLSAPAVMFLQLCSFLHQDDISEDIFARAANYTKNSISQTQSLSNGEMKPEKFLSNFSGPNKNWNSFQFLELTNEIKAYSLISYNLERKSFSIHPLLHSWTQTTISNMEACHSCMDEILWMSITEIPGHDRALSSLRLVSHVDSLMQTIPKLTHNFQRWWYANIYWYAGQYTKAEALLVDEVERCRKCYSDDDPNTLQAMTFLAITYDKLSQFKEAEELHDVVLEKQKQLLGEDHPHTLATMHGLAATYYNLGQFEQAEKLYIVVLEKQKWLLGDDHLHTLTTMCDLALTYDNFGQLKEAEKLYVVVLEKRKKLLGNDHLDTLRTMHNLAITYGKLGQFEEAEKLYVVVLEKRKKLLGDDHPDTLNTMHNLALAYDNLGQFEEAEKLYVVVLEKWKKLLGDDQLNTLSTMHNLAITYDNMGQFEEAEKLYVVALEKQKKLLGEDHPDTLHTMHNLATSYAHLGQFKKAEQLEVVALEKRRKVLGDDHHHTLHTMENLVDTYNNLGRTKEAEKLKAELLAKGRKL